MTISEQLFQQASTLIPGGVNSPVRAFKGVGGNPVFFKRGEGPYLFDVDDRRYIDYVGSWGPLILGHAHPDVLAALRAQMENGLSYGAPTELEVQMAAQINALMPSIEMVRMVNSGTEATMSAIRLARAFAGRDKIVKFEGCYHGHADSLLVKAGSGALTLGEPSSPGVPASVVGDTITLPYNDIDALRECFEQQADSIGCVIVEPVAGNMNLILPEPGFLEAMRELCSQHGSVLIFDEVMTGFRVARGGAQERFNIKPDLTCLGKVIGGGMPVGAFGGRRDIMEHLAPSGPVYQAGTLSGNPMAMAAGLATLKALSAPGFYDQVSAAATRFTDGVKDVARRHGIPLCTATAGSMFGIFFSDRDKVSSFAEATTCDINRFQRFYHAMLNEGVYLAPSAYEAGFISAAHDNAVVDASIEAADRAMAAIA